MPIRKLISWIVLALWLSAPLPTGLRAQETPLQPDTGKPAYWFTRAQRSASTISDPADPDFGLTTRAEALSLLAQSAHDLNDPQTYSLAIKATQDCISKITDESMRNQARWPLAEALSAAGQFDQAQQTVNDITEPATRALALMTTAVAHAHLGQQANYRQLSAASEQALINAHATTDPDDPFADEAGWMWFSLGQARLQANDVPGALALVDKHLYHPADRAAALAAISEKQAGLGNKQAATETLNRALKATHQLQATLKKDPDLLADTDLVYDALALAHAALGQQQQADKMLTQIDLPDLQAQALSAYAVHLDSQRHTPRAHEKLTQARTLLDKPTHPLLINHWSWFEVSKNSMLAGDSQANTQWIDSLKDPTTRALAELGALRGLIERANRKP
jgi:tetratricopeptide (TPR) repeat protein